MRRGLTCFLAAVSMAASVGAAPVTNHQNFNDSRTKTEVLTQTPGHKPKTSLTQSKASKFASAVAKAASKPAYQLGLSSWYGRQFHGKKTASGEPFDMYQFTAAHRNLPLGTWLKVTNVKNGKWVVVRVNDRGPVPQSRILDLSYGAAQMLKFGNAGVTRVRLDLMKDAGARAVAENVAVAAALP